MKLLRKSSVTFMWVTWVETGAVCKLLDKWLQQGTVSMVQVNTSSDCNNEAGVVRDFFDQLHRNRWSFCDSLIMQQSLRIYAVARQYAEPNSTVCGMECSDWAESLVLRVERLVGIDICIEITLEDQEWRKQALLCAQSSIAGRLVILLKWQLVLTSGAYLNCVLLLVVYERVADIHCPTAHKFHTGADRGTFSTAYLGEMSTRGSGPLVDLKRSTPTLCDGQFLVRLGSAVFKAMTKCVQLQKLSTSTTFYHGFSMEQFLYVLLRNGDHGIQSVRLITAWCMECEELEWS
ncbi:hypothetical protein C5167_050260 [Papaver somniferum]|uniref:Uncharacterized protein n=2 Tax=Papaver somniferum TaxID=3469 RepID=A0A4Y7KPL4_PAPSO|nr:hypothetical protein C5167_050260 [Papaver somniferum]